MAKKESSNGDQYPKREDLLARGYRVPEANYTATHPADDPTGGPELRTIEDDRPAEEQADKPRAKRGSGPSENK